MKQFARIVVAIFLIIIGLLWILANINVISFDVAFLWAYIYPVILVIFGSRWLINYVRKDDGSWFWGCFFILFGLLLLLDRFQIIAFSFWDVLKLWPLLIIYVGFMLISRRNYNIINAGRDKPGAKNGTGSLFSIGSYDYTEENWKAEPMKLNNMAGDFYFDFSKAFIPEEEIPISIRSLAGDVTILMPETIPFHVEASMKAGEINILGRVAEGVNRSLAFTSDEYDASIRKINFTIILKAGSIKIDYV
ncbi:cell wall-active antibiotics response protein LiaF [Virgibacillus salexigens]|uniref:Cell wall-active antibiotics response LiaF-like C-terminal domain-containing protein n=2 Tax=Virgibacillus TaxID=84406 RepID=A0ABQ2DR30_9BACI|nr:MULTISPECIES: cell wall-active antibiotics response protein LiaF [Virgibacillus]GGJ69608.1 hypothetical protein GCM10007111_34110 [Virgibacillus kapii]CDQ40702.1 putative membrane protein [Virgibacillus massiliensis]